MSLRAYGCNTSESDAKVDTAWTPRRISDATHFLGDRAYAHSTTEATIQDQEVSQAPSVPEALRTLTFAELQSLIEQGKLDEIPNNKHIPDTINIVLISYSILGCLAHNVHDRRPYPASRAPRAPRNAKNLGGSHRSRNDVRTQKPKINRYYGVKRICPSAFQSL
jgi:hypothetical protein